jgi:hypothetical protein
MKSTHKRDNYLLAKNIMFHHQTLYNLLYIPNIANYFGTYNFKFNHNIILNIKRNFDHIQYIIHDHHIVCSSLIP